jgi:hypothetical protein
MVGTSNKIFVNDNPTQIKTDDEGIKWKGRINFIL